GKPMIDYVLMAAGALNPIKKVVVIGHKADEVKLAIDGAEFALQKERLGTGHAVLAAEDILSGFSGTVLIVSGDTPLIKAETLNNLVSLHESSNAAATILTARLEDPTGYGRIIRNSVGEVAAIV